jgi:hypothetical protein
VPAACSQERTPSSALEQTGTAHVSAERIATERSRDTSISLNTPSPLSTACGHDGIQKRPQCHWRSFGTANPLPTAQEALDELFCAFPS